MLLDTTYEHLVSVSFQVRNRPDVICFVVKCAKTVKVQIKVKNTTIKTKI